MTFDEAATKFRGCAHYAEWPRDKTENLITYTRALESMSDIRVLLRLLSLDKG